MAPLCRARRVLLPALITVLLGQHAKAVDTLAVTGGNPVAVGEYLVAIGGCNDCHTDGWAQKPGQIPLEQQLTGSVVGWHGPWGTSYPVNLRLLVQKLTPEQWVSYIATMQPKPPMPVFNMRAMSEQDLRAIYAYIHSLGAAGEMAPVDLPPGKLPTTPYIEAEPQMPKP
jgi:hypothetical protein